MSKVTSHNYIKIYCAWCLKNNFAPLRHDVIAEIFYGCETNKDYEDTLEAFYFIQLEGFKLSFMPQNTDIKTLSIRLNLRLELFKRVPTATNMLLAYNLIEEITLKVFAEQAKDISDEMNKSIERFDKCKALALGTKYINERKLAFERSLEIFKKLTNIELNSNGTK